MSSHEDDRAADDAPADPTRPGSATDDRTEYATSPEQGAASVANVPLADADVDAPTDDPGPDVDPRHERAQPRRHAGVERDGSHQPVESPDADGQTTWGDW